MYIELGVVALPEKNIAQLHEAPAVSFARCFSEWHRWMSFGENNAICPPFHGISSLFFPFCAGILSIRRRFFHATTFFLKVCLENMVCNFRRWSLMVHVGPGGMDSQYSENGPNDRPSMV